MTDHQRAPGRRRKWVLQPPRHCAGGELTMTDLPPEVIIAAYVAARDPIRPGEMKRILDAAAPLIAARAAAAEREREFVLVWRDERGEEIARCPRLQPGTTRIGIPLDAQHADLLEDKP